MNIFTAHKREVNGRIEIETVAEHSRRTAGKAEQYAEKIGTSAIARLQGMIHDAGKLCGDFNEYILEKNDFRRGMIDHCYAGARFLMQIAEKSGEDKMIETARFISHTVISHHGLHDWVDKEGNDYFRERISKNKRYEEIKNNLVEMLPEQEWMNLLCDAKNEYIVVKKKIAQIGGKDKVQFAFYMGQFERLMQSVLIDADRTKTMDFQTGKITEAVFEKKIWELFCERVERKCKIFGVRNDPVSKLRCDISERCRRYADQETEICRLVVPTGGGKTISSLRYAVHYCTKHGKERIFYIAPFRTILDQNCEEWKKIVGEQYVLEHHSDMIASLETKGEITEYELRSDKWDMPIIATTLVQFFNTFFSARLDSVRRMHRLCNAVIIIDEIQSIPTECVSLFNMEMNFISTIGKSTVVLCSATQPALGTVKYPLRIDDSRRCSMTGDYSRDFLAFRRNEIISVLRKSGYTYAQAAGRCNRNGEEGKCCQVYLLNLCEERIGNMKAIKTAQDVSRQVIESSGYEDLASVEVMEIYFQKYYMECKNNLGYNVEDVGIKTDLVNLLSLNKCRNRGKNSCRVQAFKTAGELFKMIDESTISVIVPYNEEAKNLIIQLRLETSNYEIIKILRRAQKYTVSLSERMKKELEGKKALELLLCGVWILQEGYYDRNVGICWKGRTDVSN